MQVRPALIFVLLAACNDDVLPTSSGSLSSDPSVLFAHATIGFTSHGAADRAYTIALTATDDCGAAAIASMEIDLLANGSSLMPSTIPIRTTDLPDVLPSALWMPPPTGGTITITSADAGRIQGSASVTTASGTQTASFSALVCSTQ